MAKRLIKVRRLHESVIFNGDVEFCLDCVVEGDLTAKKVIAIGRLEVLGILTCESLENPPDILPVCGRLIVAGEDLSGTDDIDSPVVVDPDDLVPEEGVLDVPEVAVVEENFVDGTAAALDNLEDEGKEDDPLSISLQEK